jgi:BirA family biotin operon repressor/biotin-[acetyl-CoA-carboxylase] ligase
MLEKIVGFLKNSKEYVSGEALSRALGMTRAAVWKHMQELRGAGYVIEAVPRRGYRLVSSPDLLTPAEVLPLLKTRVLGRHVVHADALPSTMNEAFRLAEAGAVEGTLVIAETQTQGRGRMGRVWSSPRGKGIYMSLILRPSCAPTDAARLTLTAAVAVAEGLQRSTGIEALIKWPNDLLVDGRKLCGILTEMRAETDRVSFIVLGIGVNVNNSPQQLLPEGISIRQILGRTVPRAQVLADILSGLESYYALFSQGAFSEVLKAWKRRSGTIGRTVRFVDKGRMVEGVAVDLDTDGALLVKLGDGRVVRRISGDVLV